MQDRVVFYSEDLFTSETVRICICVGELIDVAGIDVQLHVLLGKRVFVGGYLLYTHIIHFCYFVTFP